MLDAKEQSKMLAYMATVLTEDELLLLITQGVMELVHMKQAKEKFMEGEQRKFLKFVMGAYITKFSYVDPYEIVSQTEVMERIAKLITPSEG